MDEPTAGDAAGREDGARDPELRDPTLARRLARLQAQPDTGAALDQVTAGARLRRLRRRATLATGAAAASIAIIAGITVVAHGAEGADQVRTLAPPTSTSTSTELSTDSTVPPAPGSTTLGTVPLTESPPSDDPGSTTVVPESTAPPIDPRTTNVPAPGPTTSTTSPTPGRVTVSIQPERTEITAGDDVWVDVSATNNSQAPVVVTGGCGDRSDVVHVTAAEPALGTGTGGTNTDPSVGQPWPGGDATSLGDLFARAPEAASSTVRLGQHAAKPFDIVCTAEMSIDTIEPGQTRTNRLLWESAARPDQLGADRTVQLTGVLADDGYPNPQTYTADTAHATILVHPPAGPLAPIATVLRAAGSDPRVLTALTETRTDGLGESSAQLAVSYLYRQGQWQLLVDQASGTSTWFRWIPACLITSDATTGSVLTVAVRP
jgi:hypothetical protein